jgi:hypothetical protein
VLAARRALSSQWPLIAAGLGSIALYWFGFTSPYPLAQWWQQAFSDYGTISGYALSAQVAFVGAFVVLFALYGWALAHVRARASSPAAFLIIRTVQVVAGLVMVAAHPVAALDIYDYIIYARLGLYWGANPLVQTPSMFPGEPTIGFSYWPNEPSVYGPLWQSLSERVVTPVDGQVLEGMIAFKLVALVAAIGTSVVIWLALRRLQPAFAASGALVWAWNPLQVFETAGNAHNDAVMVMCMAIAVLLLVYGFGMLVLPALGAGLLIKITLAPVAPILAIVPLLTARRVRDGVVSAGVGILLSVGLAVAAYGPYWSGQATLAFLDRGNWFTASPPTLLREVLRTWLDFETAGQRAALICAVAFAAMASVMLGRLALERWRASGPLPVVGVISTTYHVYFAYLVVACLWWQPWYLLVLLILGALSTQMPLVARANLFCIGGLLSYVVFKYIWQVHQADWQLDYAKIMTLSVLVIFPLPLVHLAASTLIWRSRGSAKLAPELLRGEAGALDE